MRVVVDASVVVKWFFPEQDGETEEDLAVRLLEAIRDGRVEPIQPAHWLAEVVAVVTRLRPAIVAGVVDLLDAMEFPVVGEAAVYHKAARLAFDLREHVFDTLYHAVARERQATLITADYRYCRRAERFGSIARLADWGRLENVPGL